MALAQMVVAHLAKHHARCNQIPSRYLMLPSSTATPRGLFHSKKTSPLPYLPPAPAAVPPPLPRAPSTRIYHKNLPPPVQAQQTVRPSQQPLAIGPPGTISNWPAFRILLFPPPAALRRIGCSRPCLRGGRMRLGAGRLPRLREVGRS